MVTPSVFVIETSDTRVMASKSLAEFAAWASYERWPGRDDADVAFMVDDVHRGKGIATYAGLLVFVTPLKGLVIVGLIRAHRIGFLVDAAIFGFATEPISLNFS